ncbi:MAG: hypothetical protein KC589_00015 [Nanoarchaeota archaeon]|nr:hypothetical protein [Nanoarchaeota archaeon]
MGRQIYLRKKDFEIPPVGTKLCSVISNFSYGGSGEVWRLIDFIDAEGLRDNSNGQYDSVPIMDGMSLRLLSFGEQYSDGAFWSFTEKFGNNPFEVSLGEKSENTSSADGVEFDSFENVLEMSRKLMINSCFVGVNYDHFSQKLALGKSAYNNIPDGTKFEVLGYSR